jgi:uncharacterized repeat protein (TIGR04076 family)
MARSKVKLTVLKRVDPSVIFDGNVPTRPGNGEKYGICTVFKEGQEFIVGLDGEKPQDFCGWAWRDVYKDVSILRFGGTFYTGDDKGMIYTCCTDGARPVSFKIERIEE